MQKQRFFVTLASVGAAAVVFGGAPGIALATGPDANLNSKVYKVKLVQAMDECDPPVTMIGGLSACPRANVVTDGTSFKLGRVTLQHRINFLDSRVLTSMRSAGVASLPDKPLAGLTVHTRLVLRVTQSNTIPAGATWVDQTINCPNVTVPASGNYIQIANLAACGLPVSLSNLTYVKEIVSVSVINNANGKAIAVPGLRRKP